MDAQTILDTARSGKVPDTWNVWPLRVERVRRSALGWSLCALAGFIILIPVVISTIPYNFTHGTTLAIFAIVILMLVGAVAFGSLGIAIYDIWRIMHAREYLLVITPEDYLRIGPHNKQTHVPIADIAYVTMKGVKVNDPYAEARAAQASNMAVVTIACARATIGGPGLAALTALSSTLPSGPGSGVLMRMWRTFTCSGTRYWSW